MNQFLVLYTCLTCTDPVSVLQAFDLAPTECVSLAVRHTEGFAKTKMHYIVKCQAYRADGTLRNIGDSK